MTRNRIGSVLLSAIAGLKSEMERDETAQTHQERFLAEVESEMEHAELLGKRMTFAEACIVVERRDGELAKLAEAEGHRGSVEHRNARRLLSERGKKKATPKPSERLLAESKPSWRMVRVVGEDGRDVKNHNEWLRQLLFWRAGKAPNAVFTVLGHPLASPNDVDWNGDTGSDPFEMQAMVAGVIGVSMPLPDRSKSVNPSLSVTAEDRFMAEVSKVMRASREAGKEVTFSEAVKSVAAEDVKLFAEYEREQEAISKGGRS